MNWLTNTFNNIFAKDNPSISKNSSSYTVMTSMYLYTDNWLMCAWVLGIVSIYSVANHCSTVLLPYGGKLWW